ncbi:DNA/RNA polymerases superfamily protein [Gossypium australe]|uniref:DNA/RNA polymerases superfamily protein n=1 Tax=Gossypium australe TaxID=47621 RepID=A0A5B6VM85_9ROSI|nr:DNA/RNA polymerases superfamily protein [Gossypium australe]
MDVKCSDCSVMPLNPIPAMVSVMDPDRAVADDVESNASALAQGIAPATSRPNDSIRLNKSGYFITSTPQVPVVPQVINLIQLNKPPVDKIHKYGVEEFRATDDDDAERAEFWLENTIRVFDQMSLTPDECIKCAVSLLRDTTYNWWKKLISVVSRERIAWDFFQIEFRKKYTSQRFIDQKHKEFLELKQGRLSITEYEQEFVRLS